MAEKRNPDAKENTQLMKLPCTLLLGAVLLACKPAPDDASAAAETKNEQSDGTASFRVGNDEIREDMIRMLDEAGIEYSLGGDGTILYNLDDGETIDKIGNEAISEYITRN